MTSTNRSFLFVAGLFCTLPAFAQPLPYHPVFDDAYVPKIFIQIDQASLDQILDPANAFSDEEFPATFIFSSPQIQDTVKNIGFRLRGNTSRLSQKKSFKVSFNTFEQGRKFYGLEKLNLNGEHNDPSIIRSKLSWDLFQSLQLPASRANHVELYVNGEYRGLYINVEHIDEQFLQSRFGNDEGNLYKCLYPADLTFRGFDGDDYKFGNGERRTYDLKLQDTDAGAYDDLAHFIDVLNNTSDNGFQNELESVFDVNGYLEILAVDVATGSWDDYWYLMNNYYLYFNPETALFHFIPFDYDNTFGIDFVNQDWGTRNVYNWGHPTDARPLTARILNVETYRNRFTFYLKRLLVGSFEPAQLFPRIDQLRTAIQPAAEADVYRTLDYGYDTDDFLASYTQALGGHVEYGLKPYIQTRYDEALNQLDPNINVKPIIYELSIRTAPARPAEDDPITFSLSIDDESDALNVILEYRLDGQSWQTAVLNDDGTGGDLAAGDGVYSGMVPALGQAGTLSYIVSAQDAEQQISFSRIRTLEVGFPRVDLRINEFMASNSATIADEAGEYDDWVEIYNAGSTSLSLEGKFLTDNLSVPDKWQLPPATIDQGGFLLIWMDEDTLQGPLHAPFKLSADGEQLGLFGRDDTGFYPIDTLSFNVQLTDLSSAREIDGSGAFVATSRPTPGGSNLTGVSRQDEPALQKAVLGFPYPNPFRDRTTFTLELSTPGTFKLEVFDLLGRNLFSIVDGPLSGGKHNLSWVGTDRAGHTLPAGVYFFRMDYPQTGERTTRKVIYLRQ